MRRASAGGLTIRAVLVLGFGLLVGSWLFAWSYFRGDITALEERSTEISERYMQAQEQLSLARGHIYDASIMVRDAVFSPIHPPAENRSDVEAAYASADRALESYRPILEGDAGERINRLRQEIDSLRAEHLRVLSPDTAALSEFERARLLDQTTSPRRDQAISIAEELQLLNRQDFISHQATTAQLYRETQQRFTRNLGIALVASLGIALFAGLQAGRLEDRLRQQRLRDLENQQTLQRLSAKLLTAQEEERRSIARELHDEVGQVLTAVKVELAVAQHKLAAEGGQVSVLEDARLITDRALHTVRDLSRLLHPSLLDDMGLPAALDWYIKGYRKRHNITVDFEVSGMAERLAQDVEVGAYRIIQEALTNIVRHADTSVCSVRVQCEDGQLRIVIADQGAGFDVDALERTRVGQGLGLVNIRERVSHLGGTFRIESRAGQGTALNIVLPARLRAPDPSLGDEDGVGAEDAGAMERVG